jgi:hypothetical protein
MERINIFYKSYERLRILSKNQDNGGHLFEPRKLFRINITKTKLKN